MSPHLRITSRHASKSLDAHRAKVLRLEPLEDRMLLALVAAYAFNEGSGATAADASGTGNTGTIINPTWNATGRYGAALAFNGSNRRVDIANSASLQLTTAMTLEAWVRPTTVNSAWRDVIYKGNDNYYLSATTTTSGRPAGGAIAGGSHVEAFGTAALAVNTWTHLATTYDGAALRLYVNGALVSTVARTGTIATSTNPLQIGGDSIFGQYFAGMIDEVRVYNSALTQAQIQTDLNTPIGVVPPDTQPPTAPGTLTAAPASTSQINLSWGAASDNVGVTGYRVERQGPGDADFVQIAAPTGTTLNNTGLSAGSGYSYRVRASDAAGNLGPYSNVAAATTLAPDTQPPTAPGNLAATPASGSQINLSWSAATDNVGVTGYRVERQGPGDADFIQIGTPTGTTFNNTGLAAGIAYSYRVRAVDAAGNLGPFSGVASATTLAPDTQNPTAPAGLAASATSASQINLSWIAATDNVGVTNYLIERSDPGNPTFAQIGTSTTTSFGASGLAANSNYGFRARATDAAGNLGPYSNVANATTLSAPSTLVAAYSFNEGVGGIAGDTTGNGNSGALVNATWSAAGKYGQALSFNGTNARVDIVDSASLRLTTGMTLEAWVNPSIVPNAWRDVIYKGNDNYYLSASTSNGSRPAGGAIVVGAHVEAFGGGALAVNTWTHLAATFDGAAMRLYVNGTLAATTNRAGAIITSSNPLQIGGDTFFGQYFAGLIDEVRIYSAALTQSQIQADMNSPISGAPTDTTPPTVALTSPLSGATISHVTAITATASDDIGLLGVEFFLDGVSLGSDTSSPFYFSWNSNGLTNGNHALTAVARDLAGNQTTSAPVPVTVINPGFANEVVVPGIAYATTIAFLPDGRLLIGELPNQIWVVQPGASQPDATPFLSLGTTFLFGEQGLNDIIIDPDFATNGFYYVFYTKGFSGQNNRDRLSRFTASGNGTVPNSELVLWQDDQIAADVHHGGGLAFGADGKLYFTTGDHLVPQDAQRLNSYRGKLMRINSDGTIPIDNPFHDGAGPNRDEIWAYGLRNPYRISVDSLTGRLYIGEVGGNDDVAAWEEVNIGVPGANYGWPLGEGDSGVPGTTAPLYTYFHNNRDASMTGGFVYRGSQFPSEYYGSYFFGDYAQNTLKRLTLDGGGNVTGALNFWPDNGALDGPSVGDPVKLVQGPDGALYYVDIGFDEQFNSNTAAIRRIRYVVSNQPPVAVANAAPLTGLPPLTVAFSSAGSLDPEGLTLTYLWEFGDGANSTAANPTHTYANAGRFVARLTVSDGASATLSADLVVTVGNAPTPVIQGPAPNSTFRAGDVITYQGIASDVEDGALPASALSWQILFHHDSHAHPAGGPFAGVAGGTLTVPSVGHDFQGDTSYELVLTATDSTGLTGTTSVTVFPEKVNLAFSTVPSGLTISVDGVSRQTPFVLDDLIGFQHTILAPTPANYTFVSWSDGGAQSHAIVTPASNQSFVATFQAIQNSGLVAAYGFNEGSGSTAADASGTGNAGTIVNPTWSASGRYGAALSFNGSNRRVDVPNSSSLQLTTAMTLEAWVNPTTVTSAWRDVIYKGNDNFYLSATTSSSSRPAGGAIVSGGYAEVFGAGALPVNTWTHLTTTFDGAALRLYVNGALVSTVARAGTIATSTNPLQIGGDSIFGQYFAGTIDEVRVYNTALSQTQIQADMNTPIGALPVINGRSRETAPQRARLSAQAFPFQPLLTRGRPQGGGEEFGQYLPSAAVENEESMEHRIGQLLLSKHSPVADSSENRRSFGPPKSSDLHLSRALLADVGRAQQHGAHTASPASAGEDVHEAPAPHNTLRARQPHGALTKLASAALDAVFDANLLEELLA